MSVAVPPQVSVIIATYNWSAALRLALQSVRSQTFTDYEVLVVGDACTDDSAAVVAEFADPRFRWENLPNNHGSQWAPNNRGLELARGEFIAYLGHDDIWYPTHLENCLATARATGADVVGAICLMHGPTGSNILGVTGLLVERQFTPNQFMPPSSIVHRRDLVERIGFWRDPDSIDVATDADFLLRAHEAKAVITSTDDLTVYKFNAAFRRDIYRSRRVDDQRAMLERIRSQPDLSTRALKEALRAAIEGRLITARTVRRGQVQETRESRSQTRRFKGSPSALPAAAATAVEAYKCFTMADQFSHMEWFGEEGNDHWPSFRWSGPHVRSSAEFPVIIDRPLRARATIVQSISEDVLAGLVVEVQGKPVSLHRSAAEHAAEVVEFDIPWCEGAAPTHGLLITFVVPHVRRPCDLMINDDERWLGIAVSRIELSPVPAATVSAAIAPQRPTS